MKYIFLLMFVFTNIFSVELIYVTPTKLAYVIDNNGNKWTKKEIINGAEMLAALNDFNSSILSNGNIYYRIPKELRSLQIKFRIESTGDPLADAAVQSRWKNATNENKQSYEKALVDLKEYQKTKNLTSSNPP